MKLHRVRLPEPLSRQIEAEAERRGITVSQLLRERILSASTGEAATIQLLGNILKESIIARKYSAYSLATSVDDREALRQMAARFHAEAEESKNKIVSALTNEG